MCPILLPLPINTKDEIYNINAIACDKRTWICKSMGNSQFHDMLLTYYGEERLRYIYLIRDCRDVALSFMRTPVGDCHYYTIITKWTNLQRHALHVLSVSEDLVHQVSGFSACVLYYLNLSEVLTTLNVQ